MPPISAPDTPAPARRQFFTSLAAVLGEPAEPVGQGSYWIRVYRRAMACRFEVTLADSEAAWVGAARKALDRIGSLEDDLSLFKASSVLCAVNRSAARRPVKVPRYLLELLQDCATLHADTDGAFDVTTTPLSRCWGFLRREGCVPSAEAIDAARASVGWDAVALDEAAGTVTFTRPGIELNLGAIGKGYALDRAGAALRASGAAHALLSAGHSSLLALGGRGQGWQVDLVSPLVDAASLATVFLRDAALGTSGAGEQFVLADGRRYGHVIDPRTGWPASGVVSASVIAASAAAADALSTAFLVGGAELATRYCAAHPGVAAVITPQDAEAPLVIGSHPGARIVTHCLSRRPS